MSLLRWRCGMLAAVIVCLGLALTAQAATFYVDPVSGSPAGDGSEADPWLTIEQVITDGLIESWTSGSVPINPGAPVVGGDTILLRSGYHGEIILDGYYNRTTITIAAEDGHTPQIRRIRLAPGSFWTFRGLTISPSFAPVYEQVTLVDIYSRFIGISRMVVVEDCFLYSVLDTSGWSAADWVSKSCHGINLGLDGMRLTARNNRLLNVDFAIVVASTDSVAEYNEVTNFSGDGINATNDGAVVQYNLIRNNFAVDDNHDDGIQGYKAAASGTLVRNVTLRGNIIINRTDPNQPHQGALQGIGCFDGPYENWRVENNIVITDHWHGITFMGGEGCTVINNTVFNPWYNSGQSSLKTWILIDSYKSGAKSNDCVVRNNIAPDVLVSPTDNTNATVDHNLIIPQGTNADLWFVDADNWDLRLAGGSAAIDSGSLVDAPELDADEFHRPMGILPDIGAYEFGSIPPLAANAGDDQTLPDANDDGIEVVILDGSASYCLNGTITAYLWTRDGSYVGSGVMAPVVATVGDNTFTLRVTTSGGAQAFDEVTYTVGSGATPGDADGDGDVDLDDFVILKQNFGTPTGAAWSDGDFDGDGNVDLDDFVILKQNFGN